MFDAGSPISERRFTVTPGRRDTNGSRTFSPSWSDIMGAVTTQGSVVTAIGTL